MYHPWFEKKNPHEASIVAHVPKKGLLFKNGRDMYVVCPHLCFPDADTSSLFHYVFMEENGSCEESAGASAPGRLPEYV